MDITCCDDCVVDAVRGGCVADHLQDWTARVGQEGVAGKRGEVEC